MKKVKSSPLKKDRGPPISDYGLIGDCHSTALISKVGSIDWCCMPRMDSDSCFGRLLGWETGGYCQIVPTEKFESSHCYLAKTMVLVTCFKTKEGEARVFDFMPMRQGGLHQPYQQIIRIIEGIKGHVKFKVEVMPRFDYGAIKPWLRLYKKTSYVALGGSYGLVISSDFLFSLEDRHYLKAVFKIPPNTRQYLSIMHGRPENLDDYLVEVPSTFELDFRLGQTMAWWHTWVGQGNFEGTYSEVIQRSALILKSLQTAPTGAIAAAATTSLPEQVGGSRNWDYRFSWIRDSYFSVRSLARLGFVKEANGFRRFIERSSHSSPDGLQTLFGVYGERRLHEYTIHDLDGYHGSKPVRVGNEASTQLQLDMYGLLVDLAWLWHKKGISPSKDHWLFLEHIVDYTITKWRHPDQGIWEMRGKARHFVYSKTLCWVAIDRGIKIAKDLGFQVPLDKWKKERESIRQEIEEKGYDSKNGVFIQAYGYPYMDAALLLLPMFGFVSYDDERFVRTLEKIQKELNQGGLLRRYPNGNDELEGDDGVFIACTFWLVVCLTKQGKIKQAKEFFNKALSTCNDLCLFSEEYDPAKNQMLGNFPQAFTHLSFILAAIALCKAEGQEK
jgi:GH15 family glucan-1,4-alpha-glucosidase